MSGDVAGWLKLALAALSLLVTIFIPLIGALYRANLSTERQLSAHKTHVAETHPTKNDIKDLADRVDRQMKNGFEQLEKLITKNR